MKSLFLLSLMSMLIPSESAAVVPRIVPHQVEISPLDTHAVIGGIPRRRDDLIDSIATLPNCQQQCSSPLLESLRLFIRSGNHIERFHNICNKYLEARDCINRNNQCEAPMLFEVVTSGLKYMCIDQFPAFNATIECIDSEAVNVQNECEKQCNTQSVFTNLILQSGISNLLFGDGSSPGIIPGASKAIDKAPQLNSAMLKQTISDGCRIGQCLLACVKAKFNTRCQGSAGTLLTEVFIRPVAEGQQMMSVVPIAGLLSNIVPNECSFLLSANEMRKFRIDPALEQELHRMYDPKFQTGDAVGNPSTTTVNQGLPMAVNSLNNDQQIGDEQLWMNPHEKLETEAGISPLEADNLVVGKLRSPTAITSTASKPPPPVKQTLAKPVLKVTSSGQRRIRQQPAKKKTQYRGLGKKYGRSNARTTIRAKARN